MWTVGQTGEKNCSFQTKTDMCGRGLNSRFMENVNKQRRNIISLSELWYDPLEFNFRRVCLTDKASGKESR